MENNTTGMHVKEEMIKLKISLRLILLKNKRIISTISMSIVVKNAVIRCELNTRPIPNANEIIPFLFFVPYVDNIP